MKHGQTEIVGIVIIVLIVTVALLFYVSSATNEELTSTGRTLYDSYSSNEVATSFAQTFLNTYISACQASMEDIIIDCGKTRKTLRCNSCAVVEQTLESILPLTLDNWDYAYGLLLTYSPQQNVSYTRYNCSRNTVGRAAPGVFLLPYYPEPGTARFELGFCS